MVTEILQLDKKNIEMESRRYRKYIRDPNVPMPKLSGTRPKQNCTPDIVTSNTANQPDPVTLNSKRRRLYLHDPSIPIPRTTLWYQSKYHSSLPVCQNFSDRDEQEPPSDPESPSNQDVQEPPCDQDSQDPPSEWDDQQRLSNLGDQEPPSYQDSQDPSSDRDDREQLSDQSSQDPPSDWDDQEPPSDSGDQDPPSDWDDQEPPSDSGDQDPPSDWDDPDPSSDQELDMNHHPTGNRSSDHEDPNSSDPPTDDPDSEANREPLSLSLDPAYDGAPISTIASWVTIRDFAVSNNLTDTATQQLLDLIQAHLPLENSCPRTVYKLKNHYKRSECQNHLFCTCMEEISSNSKQCSKKGCKGDICHFSILPVEKLLRRIFSEKWDSLQYPFTRKQTHQTSELHIQDIHDGFYFRKWMEPGQFLAVPEHTGLVMCADGVPLFRSSKASLWPIQLAITSLPPSIRFSVENLLLAGVWLGPVKPNMSVILPPILKQLEQLRIEGVSFTSPAGPKILKAQLVLGVFDLPAKAMVLNCTQFNGRYGCPYCLDKGTHWSNRQLYLPNDTHQARSTRDVLEWAQQAEQTGKPVKGVKGTSVLSRSLDVVKCIPVDYMHAVLEGVAKTLTTSWFNSKYHGLRFYLKHQMEDIDKMLLRIKPPSEIPRTPRSIMKNLPFWKANEYRAWLLFYSLPILRSFLPSDYIYHLALLVSAIHILLSTDITSQQISQAEELLQLFYEFLPSLYPKELCTMNVHSLIHLPACVRRWGPLWCYSRFCFENMNGFLKKQCHSTKNVIPQMIRALSTRQSLPALQKQLCENENGRTLALLHKIGSFSKLSQPHPIIGPFGRIVLRSVTNEEKQVLDRAQLHAPNTYNTFQRFAINGMTIHAREYTKNGCVRNNSICSIKLESDTVFGSVETLCDINGSHMAITSVYEIVEEQVLDNLLPPTVLQLQKYKVCTPFIFKVKKLSLSKTVVTVPVENILSKCVLVPIKHSPTDIIIVPPNSFEHH